MADPSSRVPLEDQLASTIEALAVAPVPLIAVTAYGRPQDKRRALAVGFRLHLTKPVEPAALAAALVNVNERSSD